VLGDLWTGTAVQLKILLKHGLDSGPIREVMGKLVLRERQHGLDSVEGFSESWAASAERSDSMDWTAVEFSEVMGSFC
jgi:hypothetical protein